MDETHPQPPPAASSPAPNTDLEQVRELLLGPERRQLGRLKEQIEDPEQHAEAVSRVLPSAIRRSVASGDQLARELAGPVEATLQDSVRRRPEILTTIVYPVLGPAIRRSVSEALSRLVQGINQALENSLSLRALRWRLEAWRTGRSYAEILLYHTLVYRVEQLLLVQRPSGLLLHHVTSPEAPLQDGDVVSGMLTAIQDFVMDSFRGDAAGPLQTLEIGAFKVWVETGPSASLAAVIRGHPPAAVRESLQRTLERLHRECAPGLLAQPGHDPAPQAWDPLLVECLTGEFHPPPAGPVPGRFLLVSLLLLLAVAAMLWGSKSFLQHRRWTAYLDRLRSEEGLVVADSRRSGGTYQLTGWRDPAAIDPASLLPEFQIHSNSVRARWEPYLALTPGIVLRRAQEVLQPPGEVRLHLDGATLHASGTAPASWTELARERAPAIPGIRHLDTTLLSTAGNPLEDALRQLQALTLFFEDGIRLAAGQEDTLERLAAQLRRIAASTRDGRTPPQISVVGHTDRTGTADYNLRLSRDRAEEVRRLLETRGIPPALLAVEGAGTNLPLRSDLPASEEHRNRRVTFRARLTAPDSSPP